MLRERQETPQGMTHDEETQKQEAARLQAEKAAAEEAVAQEKARVVALQAQVDAAQQQAAQAEAQAAQAEARRQAAEAQQRAAEEEASAALARQLQEEEEMKAQVAAAAQTAPPSYRPGDLVSVYSRSMKRWVDGVVLETAPLPEGVSEPLAGDIPIGYNKDEPWKWIDPAEAKPRAPRDYDAINLSLRDGDKDPGRVVDLAGLSLQESAGSAGGKVDVGPPEPSPPVRAIAVKSPPKYWTDRRNPDHFARVPEGAEVIAAVEDRMRVSIRHDTEHGMEGFRVDAVERIENAMLWDAFYNEGFCKKLRRRAQGRHCASAARCGHSADQATRLGEIEAVERWLASGLAESDGVRSVADRECFGDSRVINSACNELWLWHGTKPDTADILAEEGFDERVARDTGLYGAGSYFADCSSKSHQYRGTHRGARVEAPESMREGKHCMLLCRVLMGDAFQTTTTHNDRSCPTRKPPCGKDSIFAEEGVANGGQQTHNEYVVFRSQQVYPEYIVWYSKRPTQAALDGQLCEAAMRGDVSAIERLAAEGASPNAKSRAGVPDNEAPAVVIAAWRGHARAVSALVRLGADLDARSTTSHTSMRRRGFTALMGATQRGKVECVRALLAGGADRTLRCEHGVFVGKTALEIAEKQGRAELAALLRSPAEQAAFEQKQAAEKQAAVGGQLCEAAVMGDAAAIEALVLLGADLDARDSRGETALMKAAAMGEVECARVLLEAGADRTLRATGGDYVFQTALGIAEEECEAEVAALLRE